jgi:hypothetical protein
MIMASFEETKAEIAKTPASAHMALLKRIFSESAIVLGIIESDDPSNPTLYVVKHDKHRQPLTFRAVPCRNLNEAEVMKRVFGGPVTEQTAATVTKSFATSASEVDIRGPAQFDSACRERSADSTEISSSKIT